MPTDKEGGEFVILSLQCLDNLGRGDRRNEKGNKPIKLEYQEICCN